MTFKIPRGFEFSGVHCGLKTDTAKEDLSLIHCPAEAVVAGVYTQNLVYAAPVEVDRERTPNDRFRILVVNSGNANACTGVRGLEDARRMCSVAAESVGADASQALVMSTGVIGEFLPMDAIQEGIAEASSRLEAARSGFEAASRGILTTDRGPKVAGRTIAAAAGPVTVAGMAKGAGMIGPRMATMLAVVTTDAELSCEQAEEILKKSVNASFNRISVDGHMSTNDTVLLLASGQVPLDNDNLQALEEAVEAVCLEMAIMIPCDGEGASRLLAIEVVGAASCEDADRIARAVGDSPLVKTAIAGCDPNWGRIVSAAGYSGARFDPNRLSLRVNNQLLFERGEPVPFDEASVSKSISSQFQVEIQIRLEESTGQSRYWASDLTCDYVTFNADYHT